MYSLFYVDNYFDSLNEELTEISQEINQRKNEITHDFNKLKEVMSSYLTSLNMDDDFVMYDHTYSFHKFSQ